MSLVAASLLSDSRVNLIPEALLDNAVQRALVFTQALTHYYTSRNSYLQEVLARAPQTAPLMTTEQYWEAHYGPVKSAEDAYMDAFRALDQEIMPEEVKEARKSKVVQLIFDGGLLKLAIC